MVQTLLAIKRKLLIQPTIVLNLLWLRSDESGTIRGAAVTWLLSFVICIRHVMSAFELVVESQLCIGRNVVKCKEADAGVTQDRPFLCFAVGLTRMVHETGQVTTRPGVNHSMIVQRQEVVGFVSGVLLGFKSPLKLLVVNKFSAILHDKIALLDVGLGFQSPAFTTRVKRVKWWTKPLLESLVGTSRAAGIRVAFDQQHPNEEVNKEIEETSLFYIKPILKITC